MKGWILKLYFLEDRFVIILFKFLKFGLIFTKNEDFQGVSIVVGLYKLECQFNISIVKEKVIKVQRRNVGKA